MEVGWGQIDGRNHSPKHEQKGQRKIGLRAEVRQEDGTGCGRWTTGARSLEAADLGWPEPPSGRPVGVTYVEWLDGPALPSPFVVTQWPAAKAPDRKQAQCAWVVRGETQELAIPGRDGKEPAWTASSSCPLRGPTLLTLSEGRTQTAPGDGRIETLK